MFSTDLGRTSLPARGLSYSVIVHILFGIATMYVPWSYWMPSEPHLVTTQAVLHEHETLLLPNLEYLGGGGSAASSSGGGAKQKKKDEASGSSPAASAASGVVYQGPQLIISNPPHPDNVVQTILQPDLASAPKLPFPLPFPAMVSIAAKPAPAPPPPPAPEVPHVAPPQKQPTVQVAAAAPIPLPEQQPKVEVPKLPVSADIPKVAPPTALLNKPVAVPMPKLVHQPTPVATGNQAQNALVVNAVPVPERSKPAELPPGELRGAFTISPTPVGSRPGVAMASAGGGAEVKGMPGKSGASGSGSSGNGTGSSSAGGSGSGAGTGNKSGGGSGGSGTGKAASGSGAGSGHGSGNGGVGSGAGTGSGSGGHGSGNGSGPGTGSGKGNGPGTGSGNSPFPFITIQGGSSNGHSAQRAPTTPTTQGQTSYGITIVASGASGGGFRDFGIFHDEASYTVYLDMADAGARGSSWTLQYALNLQRAPDHSYAAPHGLLSPPFATSKTLPHFSAEAARRGGGGTIVVFGVITPQGKFEELRIMQSPEAGLNELLLEALKKWTFRPAEMDGGKVPVKVLLGVPVNSVPGE